MSDRLPSGLAAIDADGVAVGSRPGLDVPPDLLDQCPHRGLLFRGKGQEVRLVPPGDHEAVAGIQRVGVRKGHGKAVLGDDIAVS